MKSLLAAAVLAIASGTVAAAPVTIRNCTGAPVDIAVRDAAAPQGEVRSAIQNLPHGGTWSGQCSPAAQSCLVQVDRYLAGAINVVTAGTVCVVPTTSDTVLPLPMNACPC
ncbi:hypothetical protein [Stella sp.]|jgi:hypothetical protein|uniref:hypothetical protein n=1 Tax=Stella sp. TaxID=2912054 RepID=UPI0035B3B151